MGRRSVIKGSLNVDEGGRRVSVKVTQCEKDFMSHLLALDMNGAMSQEMWAAS